MDSQRRRQPHWSQLGSRRAAAVVLGSCALAACGGAHGDDLFSHGARSGSGGAATSGAGGTPSSGGSVASGGAQPSSGGVAASSSGGAGAGAGSAGQAGRAGSAGAIATGGAAGQASGGRASGGAAGSSGKTCEQQIAALSALLDAAQRCDPEQSSSCSGFTTNQCGCMLAVDSPSSAEAQSYASAVSRLLAECGVSCPSGCPNPMAAQCVRSGPGSAGRCLLR